MSSPLHSETGDRELEVPPPNGPNHTDIPARWQFRTLESGEYLIPPLHLTSHLFHYPQTTDSLTVEIVQEREPPHYNNVLIPNRLIQYKLKITTTERRDPPPPSFYAYANDPSEIHHHFQTSDGTDFPIKVLVWNCQGAKSEDFLLELDEMVRQHSPTVVIVLNMPTGRTDVARAFGYRGFIEAAPPFGCSTTMLMMFDLSVTTPRTVSSSEDEGLKLVVDIPDQHSLQSAAYAYAPPDYLPDESAVVYYAPEDYVLDEGIVVPLYARYNFI